MIRAKKETYIQIMKTQGVSAALTALHRDTERWEHEAFEGQEGYQPDMIRDLEGVRHFSRELWEMALKESKLTGVSPKGSASS